MDGRIATLSLSATGDNIVPFLPLHLVADLEGGRIRALWAYHSTHPLTGGHIIRPPLLPPDPDLEPAPPVREYEPAMRAGDAHALDAPFEPDGYVREPAGPAFNHRGSARLTDFYRPAFSGGAVPLQLCTIVDAAPPPELFT